MTAFFVRFRVLVTLPFCCNIYYTNQLQRLQDMYLFLPQTLLTRKFRVLKGHYSLMVYYEE